MQKEILVSWMMDVKLLLVFLTPITGSSLLLGGSPQVFRAELRLQEPEEKLPSCWVLQGLLQRKPPLLYSLLAGLFTEKCGGRNPVKACR